MNDNRISSFLFAFNIENTSGSSKTNAPVTFGVPLGQGQLVNGYTLRLYDSNSNPVQVQTDVKATWPDGSARHVIASFIVPSINATQVQEYTLHSVLSGSSDTPVAITDFEALSADPKITLIETAVHYTADVLNSINGIDVKTWLSGPVCSEWIIPAPLMSSTPTEHSHLTAYFHLRIYSTGDYALSVVVENTKTFYDAASNYPDTPSNFTYDWAVKDGATTIVEN